MSDDKVRDNLIADTVYQLLAATNDRAKRSQVFAGLTDHKTLQTQEDIDRFVGEVLFNTLDVFDILAATMANDRFREFLRTGAEFAEIIREIQEDD